MKTQLSMRQWAFLIILLPALVISLLLGGYLIYKRHVELDAALIEQGTNIAEPLALLSAHSYTKGETDFLVQALDSAHRNASPIVTNITVFTTDHQVYLSTNQSKPTVEASLPAGKTIPPITQVEVKSNRVYVRTPIWGNSIEESPVLILKGRDRSLYGYIVVELSRTAVQLKQQKDSLIFVLIICLSLVVCGVLAFWFVDKLIKPLHLFKTALEKIDKGETKTRIMDPLTGEFDKIKQGINALCKKLHIANELAEHNISEHTQELQQTVEQLEEQNIELSIARKDAQAANDVKSQFLANMSHELRTPLNGVLGFTRQLKKTPLNANQTDFLETIDSSAKNLLRIINDILDFSKLDAGKMELETLPFSLRDTVNEVMTLMAPTIFDKGLDVHLRIDNNVPDALRGDPDRIKQIIINLMGNALKFTTEGYIRVDVKYLGSDTQGHQIKFMVSDTGIGIDDEGKKRLFAAFGQADSSITRKYGGTGLGLSICKKLIDVMGGDIGFNSKVGQGSTFHFSIKTKENNMPVAQPLPTSELSGRSILVFDENEQSNSDLQAVLNDYTTMEVVATNNESDLLDELRKDYDMVLLSLDASPNSIAKAKQLISKAKEHCQLVFAMINSISPNLKEALLKTGLHACISHPINHNKLLNTLAQPYSVLDKNTAVNTVSFKGIKVLAVDDNESNLKLLSSLLTDMSVVTDIATNGQEAVAMAQKYKYDLILMDIQMPIMDGITACKNIKEESLNEQTPIISVTAHAGAEEQKKFQECGFAEYLAKPIDEEMLSQVLLEFTGIHCDIAASASTKSTTVNNTDSKLLTPEFASHPHVDWSMALERSAGKPDLAVQMLSMLIKSIPSTIEQLEMYLDEQNVDEVITIVHKFHGACCYTGVPKIRTLAERIEVNLKKSKQIRDVEPEILELLDELTKLKNDSLDWNLN